MKKDGENFRFIDLPRAIWYFIDKEKVKFVIFTILLLVAYLNSLLPPYFIGLVVDFVSNYEQGDSFIPLIYLVSLIAGISSAIAIFRLISKRIVTRTGINARYRAKVWGFEKLMGFSLDWHHKENTGNKAQRIIMGSESILEWIRDLQNSVFPAAAAFIGASVICILFNPLFSLFFLYFIVVLFALEIFFDKKISKISDELNQSMENASGTFVESAANILAVKAMGANDGMTSSVKSREKIARNFHKKRLNYGVLKWIFIQIHNGVAWGIFVLMVALLVIYDNLEIGVITTFTLYFASLRLATTQFTNQFQVMVERKSVMGRMMPFFWNDYTLHKGDKNFPPDWKKISIKDGTFRYKDAAAIQDVNLDIHKNEKIGIAGHSGSGKSTLIKLFLGLYHLNSGSFKIGEVNLNDIRHEEVTTHISVVLQETELFNFSLRENITLMREVDDETFQMACEIADLKDLIEKLPEGIETKLGERGYAFSGGERQRVGIARAVCKNAPILLLDEATSALDSTTEQRVMNGLLSDFAQDKTILIVAHRISTLKNTDRILVFDKGSIAEEGTFSALKGDPKSLFGAMYAAQTDE